MEHIMVNSLDLSFNDIQFNEHTFAKIKDALRCSKVIDLNLSGNKIGPKGFYQVSSGLNQISDLRSLSLSKCGMKIGALY
jgi:Ran GTPase-activating protein (RanGAP) involved in mRNA processing and transport